MEKDFKPTTETDFDRLNSSLYETVTHDIRVSVLPRFVPEHSNAEQGHYLYIYTVIIKNESSNTVQLMRRHWDITDGLGEISEVDGEGVIGEQPILAPEETYSYTSACPLETPTGAMRGFYTFKAASSGNFEVDIPEFFLKDLSLLN